MGGEERRNLGGRPGRIGSKMMLLACLSVLVLQQCTAFVHPAVLQQRMSLRASPVHHAANHRRAASALSMAKKGGSGGSKRKKKKAAAAEGAGGASTVSTRAVPASSSEDDEFEDAGAPMMASGGGFADVKTAKRGEVLEDGVIGSDDAREAKIEETLRKMGVQSIGQVRAAKAEEDKENKSVGQQITSIFDLIPPETQLVMERVFIAGFAVCLLFLVACGCAIGVEAYFLSTNGKLPPDLDSFIVGTLEPLFTPSLGATFLFSSCLGVLKLGQMGQESIVYREDD
ncbi:unnamed protein product [Ectocarpus sp. 6 AP-2014]